MNLPLITIRPEPGASETVRSAAAMGLEVESWPLSKVVPLPWQAPDAAEFDSLLLGSANAVRHGGPQLRELLALPVYAVGERTAEAARDIGLQVAQTGPGSLQPLLDGLAGQNLRLLRLAGEARVAVEPLDSIMVTTVVVYRVEHLPIPPSLAERLTEGATVLFHSAEAAAHFSAECTRLQLPRKRICLAALSPRIAEAAGEGWRAVAVAEDQALLEAAAQLQEHRT